MLAKCGELGVGGIFIDDTLECQPTALVVAAESGLAWV